MGRSQMPTGHQRRERRKPEATKNVHTMCRKAEDRRRAARTIIQAKANKTVVLIEQEMNSEEIASASANASMLSLLSGS
jgi:hypothetical protein